jgi:hypothetical protein
MSNEIEEFLRRAAQRRAARQPPPDIEILDTPVDVEIVEAEPVVAEDVATHVAKHLNTREFSERTSHLGEHVGMADDDMDAHLHQKFDHKLGRLGGALKSQVSDSDASAYEQPQAAPASSGATEIAKLLRTPQNVRNAIVLSEILTRPEHRW